MDQTRPIRKFTELLPLLNRGKFADRLDEEIEHAIQTLEAVPGGKAKATLTMVLKFNFENGLLSIEPAVKAKLPEGPGFSATPFWTVEGALSVQHPSQMDMFSAPRAVAPASPTRETA